MRETTKVLEELARAEKAVDEAYLLTPDAETKRADFFRGVLQRAQQTIVSVTEERDAARMGLFSHLTGEHALAEPTYSDLLKTTREFIESWTAPYSAETHTRATAAFKQLINLVAKDHSAHD